MASPQNKWMMELLDQNLQSDSLFWCAFNEEADISSSSRNDADSDEKSHAKKRKASQEKMRRDRLNDRFVELSSILDPGNSPKMDKTCILEDACHTLNQMRLEAKKLRSSNEKLRETIKVLKVEKMELRDEKLKLKVEKEKLEKRLGTMDVSPACLPLLAYGNMAAFLAQTQALNNKGMPVHEHSRMGMWRWMPLATLDTSQDHILRPPVA